MSLITFPQKRGGDRRRVGDWSLMRGRQIQQVGGSHPLKFHEEPLANKTKASGSCSPPCLYPSIPPRDASFRKAVPFHLSPSSILSLVGFLYKHLFMISSSIFPFPCPSVTVRPSCPPLYEPRQGVPLLPPGCSVCRGPLFSLHPRPGPALSSSVPDTCPHTHPEEGGCASRLHEGRHACLLGLIIFRCDFFFFINFIIFSPLSRLPPPLFLFCFVPFPFLFFFKFNPPTPTNPTPRETMRFGLWRGKKKINKSPPSPVPHPDPRHG